MNIEVKLICYKILIRCFSVWEWGWGLVLVFNKGKKSKLVIVVHLLVAFFLMLHFQEHSKLAKAAATTPSGSWQKEGDRPGQQKLAEGYFFQQVLCSVLCL